MTTLRSTRQRRGEPPLRARGHDAARGIASPDRVGFDPRLLLGGSEDEILRSYLDLVRTWRGTTKRIAGRLRAADVAVLVSILGTDSAEIERRLIAATSCSKAAATRGRRLLLASLGGALTVGLTVVAIGSAAAVTPVAPSPASYQAASATVSAPRSTSSTVDQGAAAPVPVAVPVVVAVPVPVAAPAAAPVAASLPGMEATVTIPSLNIDLPVIEGGQAVIDEGVAAHYVAAGWKDAVAAGAPGTYWLAAHHDTHGGPFAALPGISVGAEIRITTDTATFIYTVTSSEVVGLLPGDAAIYGVDESSPVILLQTCIDNTQRLLVHGTLTATLR